MKNALHSWPVGQLLAVRQTPSTQPPEMQRWPAPYAAAQVVSSVQSTHELATQIFPLLQSGVDVWQLPTMQALPTQT
jgi:hypothetical protein